MDELLLLEAASIPETVIAAEAARKLIPAADFTASLDYIDSLASRSALALNRRDLYKITTALSTFDYLSPLFYNKMAVPGPIERSFSASTDMRPLQDARLYSPLRGYTRPTGLLRSASDVVSINRPKTTPLPPGWRNPLDPDRDPYEIGETLKRHAKRARTPIWQNSFRDKSKTVICLKRMIRKKVINALGFGGINRMHKFTKPRRNYWSRVYC